MPHVRSTSILATMTLISYTVFVPLSLYLFIVLAHSEFIVPALFLRQLCLWTLWRIFVCARRTGPVRAVCFCLLLLYHYDECFYEVAAMRLEIELRPYIAAS
jgi:hypothetical protein